ncbi:DUF2388 domain-containing protein [Pseudomonas alcaligenes]|uniref:Holliday junction resolvasome, helicase subunit n=1 Tax=Aquipseudomonas alcaligenes TaxID=43263 RepID=A0A2V4LWY9_AQUAC|nr:DUF2388 domain-containing protein [Pseudomonas alcaligenes]PYC25637.1 holliday junction resolvasome, helicase subunit [Pseudomonas alcaligenes]
MQSRYWLAALALGCSLQVGATSFVVTTDGMVNTVDATTDVTSSTFGDDKVVREAKDDAASFVASRGDIRGAHLEAAFQHIRGKLPELQLDDMQLAQAILAL